MGMLEAVCRKYNFCMFLLQAPAMDSVIGLQWGNYVGSPDQPEPVMAWSQNHGSVIASLVALPTHDVFGLGLDSCLLVMYSKEKGKLISIWLKNIYIN